jgi:hypothetical protein
LIIERIFGKKNIIYDNEEKMRYNVSAVWSAFEFKFFP